MVETVSIVIAAVALIVSITNAWFTYFKKGSLRMTQPTVVFFGPDGSGGASRHNKVFLRTLLYSTSKKGQVIESMHITLERGETKQNFSIWVYGEKELHRGSGLFVSDSGITYNHHFLLPPDGSDFKFKEGVYMLRIYATPVGRRNAVLLNSVSLVITQEQAKPLAKGNAGIYFDWGPDGKKYYSHIDQKPKEQTHGGDILILR
jgi:hypothetical protein